MPKRDDWTEERRAAERVKNRDRMRRLSADPGYRAKVNARRKERDRERKVADPELRKRLTANSMRHYYRNGSQKRRLDREFDHYLASTEIE